MKTMATKRQIKCDMKFSINWRIVTFLDLVKNYECLQIFRIDMSS